MYFPDAKPKTGSTTITEVPSCIYVPIFVPFVSLRNQESRIWPLSIILSYFISSKTRFLLTNPVPLPARMFDDFIRHGSHDNYCRLVFHNGQLDAHWLTAEMREPSPERGFIEASSDRPPLPLGDRSLCRRLLQDDRVV